MIEMYASDLTHRKRAAAIYRNLQLQKEWFASGETIRILRQKGGNDYSYMMELEQGCNQDQCWKFAAGIQIKSGNGPMTFDPSTMTSVNMQPLNYPGGIPGNPFENGDVEYTDATLAVVSPTLDDGNVVIPMNGNDFYFFGYNAGAAGDIYWNSNNAIFFGPTTTIPGLNWESLMNFGPTDGFRDTSSTPGKGFVPTFGKYMLLGNYERRLTNFYTTQYNSQDSKYFVSRFVAVFDDYYIYAQKPGSTEIIQPPTPPPEGIFSVRLIRELVGQNRQWVEVSVIKSPPTPGYIGDITRRYPTDNYIAKDSTQTPISSPYNGNPIDANGNLIDPTKISPYDICNGTILLHTCGTTFSDQSPPTGTSFTFQGDSTGSTWTFKNNSYVPID